MVENETIKNKIKKIICVNHKGGACKSTLSQFVFPYYFYSKIKDLDSLNLNIYEIEAKNPSREEKYSNSFVKYIYHRLAKEEDIQNIFTDALFDDTDFYIFDVGGSETTSSTIKHLLRADVEASDYLFVIPFTLSEDYFLSATNTYNEIIKLNSNANILFVATKVPFEYDIRTEKYLSDKELLDEIKMSKTNIDISFFKDKNLSYIPIFMNTLKDGTLFNEAGCCLDVTQDFLRGKTVRDLTADLKNSIALAYSDKQMQKDQYKVELSHLNKKYDLYNYLDYCKPLFNKVDSFNQ